jgi:hypothetical protein
MQKLIENLYYSLPYSVKSKYWKIRDFFIPQQKWLTSKIPNHWTDKVELLYIVARESLLHFIEQEDAFTVNAWDSNQEKNDAAKCLKRGYQLITIHIPVLEKRVESLWETSNATHFAQNMLKTEIINGQKTTFLTTPDAEAKKALEQIRQTTEQIEELEQEVVEIVARYRQFMWT